MRVSILSTYLDVVRRKTAANCIRWNNSAFVSGLVGKKSRSKRHRDERRRGPAE